MTTFQDRGLIRAELITVFTANGSWQSVSKHFPTATELGMSPLLIISDGGSSLTFDGLSTNPVSHRFLITSMVLSYREDNGWTDSEAVDKAGELQKVVFQIIRDNADGQTKADMYRPSGSYSQIDRPVIQGYGYIIETHEIYADLVNGSV